MKPSHESWKTMLKPQNHTVKLWTDDDTFKFIRYMGYPHNIQLAHIARLLFVHTKGGIYADLDAYPRSAKHTQCLQYLGLQGIFSPEAHEAKRQGGGRLTSR
ncbi:hypothetical protein N7471_013484 [Penicillium samsonianum]|uniref:uncharacterized protein n=1 Tax=Penicillium samsonianum TaxID=1882272 RepID=UPI002547EA43|nr:uncharacterized protein N7471_013484 [Penicillium samsonianum]KAJ6118864.1 hypothetical protein N7471_013484 [Penicillium samsonianum]